MSLSPVPYLLSIDLADWWHIGALHLQGDKVKHNAFNRVNLLGSSETSGNRAHETSDNAVGLNWTQNSWSFSYQSGPGHVSGGTLWKEELPGRSFSSSLLMLMGWNSDHTEVNGSLAKTSLGPEFYPRHLVSLRWDYSLSAHTVDASF